MSKPGDLAAYEELRAGFTAAVSHELRTPLTRLMVLLESLSLPGAKPDEVVAQARGEVQQIGELIDDVLFLSELDTGRTVVSLGSTPALPVLDGVFAGLRERAELADVRLVLDCPASIELPIRQRMLEIVATNLVENAIRYAGAGHDLHAHGPRPGRRGGALRRGRRRGCFRRGPARESSSASTARTGQGPRAAPGSASRS